MSLKILKNKSVDLLFEYYVYLILFFLISFRINTGNDWDGYYNYYQLYKEDYQLSLEPVIIGYYYIGNLFEINDVFWVSNFSFIASVFLVYSLKKYNKNIYEIFLVFILSGLIFFAMNQSRQLIALSLFYMYVHNPKKHLIILSFLNHYTSILLYPVYIIAKKINVNKMFLTFALSLFMILHFSSVFSNIFTKLISSIEYFPLDRYESKSWLLESKKERGFSILYWYIIILYMIILTKKQLNKNLIVIVFIGFFLKVIFFDAPLITRFTNYFLYGTYFLILDFFSKNTLKNKFPIYVVLILYFIYILYMGGAEHGGLPYYNFLFDEIKPNRGIGT